MVGTAENQVAPCSVVSAQNALALNRGGTSTVPPDAKAASVEARRPWTWNRGMTQ